MTEVESLASPGPLQFGRPEPGVDYPDREAAFGVCERDGRIAVVWVTRFDGQYYDLPGGGVDAGETPAEGVAREFGEETGLKVKAARVLGHADQFMRQESGAPANNRSTLFEATLAGEDAALKIEDDHALQWLDPLEALASLRHDSHAWAVALWLRRRP